MIRDRSSSLKVALVAAVAAAGGVSVSSAAAVVAFGHRRLLPMSE